MQAEATANYAAQAFYTIGFSPVVEISYKVTNTFKFFKIYIKQMTKDKLKFRPFVYYF